MSTDFDSLLTDEQKAMLINNRIQEFAAQAFQLKLNLETARDVNAENFEQQKEEIEKSLAILDKAIVLHQKELKKYTQE